MCGERASMHAMTPGAGWGNDVTQWTKGFPCLSSSSTCRIAQIGWVPLKCGSRGRAGFLSGNKGVGGLRLWRSFKRCGSAGRRSVDGGWSPWCLRRRLGDFERRRREGAVGAIWPDYPSRFPGPQASAFFVGRQEVSSFLSPADPALLHQRDFLLKPPLTFSRRRCIICGVKGGSGFRRGTTKGDKE